MVLLVDPSDQRRSLITQVLSPPSFQCIEAVDGIAAWNQFLKKVPEVLLAAVDLPGLSTPDLILRVRAHSTTPFILHSPINDAQIAVAAMKAGADDFFVLPDALHKMASRIRIIIAQSHGSSDQDTIRSLIVGQSRLIARVRNKLLGVAGLRIPVLVRGEAGSGLDHAAQAIAKLDTQRDDALLAIRPGFMRSPTKSDVGRIVYLDQVEKLSLSDQGQWLKQIAKSERGETDAPHRVVASTTFDLVQLATQNRFDMNLAQRLSQFSIEIPPLRERMEDIGLLARHLASKIASQMGRPHVLITAPAVRLLQTRTWPGNVRELKAIVEQLLAFSIDGSITRRCVQQTFSEALSGVSSMRISQERRQREELVAILDATGGNLAEAARRLSMSRGAIIYRAQKFGLLAKRI